MVDEKVTDLSEDMEVVGPGNILKEAREAAGLTQNDVSSRLNLHLAVVKSIENEAFDKSIPATYIRGYLKSYAKLVHLSEEDILSSYESLGVAEVQAAEMQSFSKITEKQAHNTWLMSISYLILAILIGATVMLWLQNDSEVLPSVPVKLSSSPEKSKNEATDNSPLNTETDNVTTNVISEEDTLDNNAEMKAAEVKNVAGSEKPELANNNIEINGEANEAVTEPANPLVANAVFTFSGDCWVNIVGADGEKIAWGVKKSGYTMPVSGIAPFSVTLGQPELVTIIFNDEIIDMKQFNSGNIAKFSLPVVETTGQ